LLKGGMALLQIEQRLLCNLAFLFLFRTEKETKFRAHKKKKKKTEERRRETKKRRREGVYGASSFKSASNEEAVAESSAVGR
jgi:hypothetical protein